MRRVYVREWNFSEGITRFFVPTSSNSHPFLRFTLRELCWWLNETNFSFVSTFLSPHLTKIDINTNLLEKPYETVDPWCEKIPTEVVPTMRSVIKMFPSSVQFLGIYLGNGQETRLTEEISAFILGCGESLRQFHSNLVLSTEAVVHLMNLPNLLNWTTEQGPPHVADLIRHGVPDGTTSLFPSLEVLSLQGEAALEWLSILKTAKDGDLPWTMARNCLPCFRYVHSNFTIIDPTLFSRLLPLTDLVQITIGVGCLIGGSTCESRYSDQDVEGLAIALPRLEILMLGQWPCAANTCPTTIFSLLFLSVHCTNLKHLSIHFRTTDMLTDVMAMVDYAHSHDLHRRPKCALETLVTGEQIPQLEDYESELVAMGLAVIFPSLTLLKGSVGWGRLERMVALFGMVWSRKDLVETIMSLRGVGLLMEHELAVSPIVSPLPLLARWRVGRYFYSNHPLPISTGTRSSLAPRAARADTRRGGGGGVDDLLVTIKVVDALGHDFAFPTRTCPVYVCVSCCSTNHRYVKPRS